MRIAFRNTRRVAVIDAGGVHFALPMGTPVEKAAAAAKILANATMLIPKTFTNAMGQIESLYLRASFSHMAGVHFELEDRIVDEAEFERIVADAKAAREKASRTEAAAGTASLPAE